MKLHMENLLSSLDLKLTDEQIVQLRQFRDLLALSANEFNLTSLRDSEGIERRHIVESLAFGVFLRNHGRLPGPPAERHGLRLLDIGTGAGLPGIPIKIAWPEIELSLLESVGKKCRFLEQARDALGLSSVAVFEARAEDFGRDPGQRESYDLALARAVAPLPVLLEYALPSLKVGGWLAAPKGSAAIGEIEASTGAFESLGGKLHDAAPFTPPGGMTQTVVLVEKIAPTPQRYPRRAGIPSKRPI